METAMVGYNCIGIVNSFRLPHTLMALVAFFLVGCGADVIDQEMTEARAARDAVLTKSRVARFDSPPSEDELISTFGQPNIHRVEDLTLRAYVFRPGQANKVNRIAEGRGAAQEWLAAPPSTLSGGDVARLAVEAPGMIATLPLTLLVVAMSDSDGPGKSVSRRLVMAYDDDGNYRWSLCCVADPAHVQTGSTDPERTLANKRLDLIRTALDRAEPKGVQFVDEDESELLCYLAKEGYDNNRWLLFKRSFDQNPHSLNTYYWARAHRDGLPEAAGLVFWDKWGKFPDSVVRTGEEYYQSQPIASVDCRAM